MTSDFRPVVKIRQFCACALKNVQYNSNLWSNLRIFCVLQDIGVEEHTTANINDRKVFGLLKQG